MHASKRELPIKGKMVAGLAIKRANESFAISLGDVSKRTARLRKRARNNRELSRYARQGGILSVTRQPVGMQRGRFPSQRTRTRFQAVLMSFFFSPKPRFFFSTWPLSILFRETASAKRSFLKCLIARFERWFRWALGISFRRMFIFQNSSEGKKRRVTRRLGNVSCEWRQKSEMSFFQDAISIPDVESFW